MPASSSRLVVLLIVVALAIPVSGCLDWLEQEDNGDGAVDEEDAWEECESQTFEGDDGEAAWVRCRANVTGQNAQEAFCPEPDGAELRAAAELREGSVLVVVEDAEGDRLIEERISDTSGEPRNLTLDTGDASPGTWTLSVERSTPYEGSFRVEMWCPR